MATGHFIHDAGSLRMGLYLLDRLKMDKSVYVDSALIEAIVARANTGKCFFLLCGVKTPQA